MEKTRRDSIAFMLDVTDVKDGRTLSESVSSAANNLAHTEKAVSRVAEQMQPHIARFFGEQAPSIEELRYYIRALAQAVNQV
jgi:methyl-accepting chemotaxis protein